MKVTLATFSIVLMALFAVAIAQTPRVRGVAGKNYQVLKPPIATHAPEGKVEVIQMFWYGCHHCYGMEPYLEGWEQKKAAYIHFVRVPVTWGPQAEAQARLFYTLVEMNRADLHKVAFREIQVGGNLMVGHDLNETEKIQADFARRKGLDVEAFKKAFRSENVERRLSEANELMRAYKIETVPYMVIAGKYMADLTSTGSPTNLLALTDDLAAFEHSRQ